MCSRQFATVQFVLYLCAPFFPSISSSVCKTISEEVSVKFLSDRLTFGVDWFQMKVMPISLNEVSRYNAGFTPVFFWDLSLSPSKDTIQRYQRSYRDRFFIEIVGGDTVCVWLIELWTRSLSPSRVSLFAFFKVFILLPTLSPRDLLHWHFLLARHPYF